MTKKQNVQNITNTHTHTHAHMCMCAHVYATMAEAKVCKHKQYKWVKWT